MGGFTLRSTKGSALTQAEMDGNWNAAVSLADLAASSGSSLVGFIQSGGATQTVQEKLRQTKAMVDFITDATIRANVIAGTNAADLTTYVQTALDSGYNLDLQGYTYRANNLTDDDASKTLSSSVGIARIIKNANGALFTSSGANYTCINISFRGDASSPVYTGDGAVFTGDHPILINCGSRWMSGRALKCTGGHVQVYGTCDLYQTTDATASGYDVEIGVSGTATLYHELYGIYSSQSTGGILLTDVGSHHISGGQFGKLTIAAGTSPAGVNGGKTIGSRIVGNVSVAISSATFASVQFGAVTITLNAGTSGHKLDSSNTFAAGYTLTNNSSNSVVMDTFTGYASGTFTPTIEGSSSAGTGTYNTQEGWYTRVGKLVFFAIDISWSAHTGTGNIVVAGFPFASLGSASTSPFNFFVRPNSLTFPNDLGMRMQNGGSKGNLFSYATGAAPADVAMDTVATIQVCGCYMQA